MKRKHLVLSAIAAILFTAGCGSNSTESTENRDSISAAANAAMNGPANPADNKGIGKFQSVELTHPLDESMVKAGNQTYDVKCASCHKLSDEKLVGPGWKGVTDRRSPEWIMNFVTNVDEMLEKDQASKTMLEQCMVRMPNQNLKDDEARQVLEFMRKNDGKS